MSGPAFSLPPCPVCSNAFGLVRPSWAYARMTSAKRGHRCHIWTGWVHSAGPSLAGEVTDTDDAYVAKETWWRSESERLFEQFTAAWPENLRRQHRDTLDDLAHFRGVPCQRRLEFPA